MNKISIVFSSLVSLSFILPITSTAKEEMTLLKFGGRYEGCVQSCSSKENQSVKQCNVACSCLVDEINKRVSFE